MPQPLAEPRVYEPRPRRRSRRRVREPRALNASPPRPPRVGFPPETPRAFPPSFVTSSQTKAERRSKPLAIQSSLFVVAVWSLFRLRFRFRRRVSFGRYHLLPRACFSSRRESRSRSPQPTRREKKTRFSSPRADSKYAHLCSPAQTRRARGTPSLGPSPPPVNVSRHSAPSLPPKASSRASIPSRLVSFAPLLPPPRASRVVARAWSSSF
mmetsp:Transcript_8416/g.35228  ORF Transcript_8416/g.35228 Transcript_8416/m.35228 type:complete len:211 (-) Transcript_8416:285-917(-)